MRIRPAIVLTALLAAPALALAQAPSAPAPVPAPSTPPRVAPVTELAIDVPPYYEAGATFHAPPRVAVDPDYDQLLSSSRRSDIQQAMAGIAAKPDFVKPQTMIVLAMRLYDVGLRDDAVFWYYAGRDRFLTMEAVLDMRSLQLVKSAEVVETFARAAGPAMDGYAFCSVAKQAQSESRAIEWVAAHPYKLLGYTQLPALSDDRNAALAAAVNDLRDNEKRKNAMLNDPKALAQLEDVRSASHAHERFCW